MAQAEQGIGSDPVIEDSITKTYPLHDKMRADLQNRFTYHAPHPDQRPRYEALRAKAKELAEMVVRYTPPSREQSLALTHLEDTTMWANAGIAREPRGTSTTEGA